MLEDIDSLNVPRYYALGAIYHIGRENIGRRRLADSLGLTESKTRTMVEHLRDADLLTVEDTLALTEESEGLYRKMADSIKQIDSVPLSFLVDDEISQAVLLSDMEVEDSLELRDEAVRAGATGTTLLAYEGGFQFTDGERPDVPGFARDTETLEEDFGGKAEDGDLLVIVFGPDDPAVIGGLWRVMSILLPTDR